MHFLNVATIFCVTSLLGVEFCFSAFVNPAAWRLELDSQLQMLGRLGFILGRVMPVWYSICTLLLSIETWLHWHAQGLALLLTADAIWILTSVASVFLLVPINNRVVEGAADWQSIHRTWNTRHQVRIAAVAIATLLLISVLVR